MNDRSYTLVVLVTQDVHLDSNSVSFGGAQILLIENALISPADRLSLQRGHFVDLPRLEIGNNREVSHLTISHVHQAFQDNVIP